MKYDVVPSIGSLPAEVLCTAETVEDVLTWQILHAERFKPNVVRLHVWKINPEGGGSFCFVYADDDLCRQAGVGVTP